MERLEFIDILVEDGQLLAKLVHLYLQVLDQIGLLHLSRPHPNLLLLLQQLKPLSEVLLNQLHISDGHIKVVLHIPHLVVKLFPRLVFVFVRVKELYIVFQRLHALL